MPHALPWDRSLRQLGTRLTSPPAAAYLQRATCTLLPALVSTPAPHLSPTCTPASLPSMQDLPKIKVPLILGIWGGKGQGKTFQCALAYKKLGIAPIVMSAGELESGNAGEPAKLIRTRYREASDIIKKGRMCSLFINDLDAGAGRMGDTTQYTVNNQMVNATLMNIADNPTNVQVRLRFLRLRFWAWLSAVPV